MAPQRTRNHDDGDEDDDRHTSTRISSDDDDGDEDEGEEEEEGEDEDRGDDHDDDGSEEEDGDEDGDEDEQDEDEGEEEGEEEEGDEGLDAEDLRSIAGDGTVPIARLNEVLEQNRRLVEMVTGKAGSSQTTSVSDAPAFDLKAKIKERNDKLLEGDGEAAAAIDGEIAEHYIQSATAAATTAATNAIAQRDTTEAVVEVQRRYPVLNDAKKAFDRDVLDAVCGLRDTYIKRGMSQATALRKAAKFICERGAADDDDDGEERRGRRGGKKNALTLQQKRDAMRRARQQPPRPGAHGTSGRVAAGRLSEDAIAGMSEARFKQLDERTKREERGDFVDAKPGRRRKTSR